jgi:hypothetical protein
MNQYRKLKDVDPTSNFYTVQEYYISFGSEHLLKAMKLDDPEIWDAEHLELLMKVNRQSKALIEHMLNQNLKDKCNA